jgi:hypothetical protein
MPESDFRGYPDDSLFAQNAGQLETAPQPEVIAEGESELVKPIEEIMKEHEQRVAARAARWQELTDSNWPPGRIEEKLDAEFPDLKTPEKVEAENLRREAAERRHASNLHGPKKQSTKRLRNISPRDTGPPAHIAEDVRRAQGLIE